MNKPDPKEFIDALHMLHKYCPLEIVNEVQIAVFAYTSSLEACLADALKTKVIVMKDGRYNYNGRTIKTSFVYPPIPDRNSDWSAIFSDTYDYDSYVGRGATEAAAVIDLIEQVGMQ